MLEQSVAVDRVFHALSDKARRDMIERLSRGPLTVSELAAPLSMTLAAVVQHVQVLETSGVITTAKSGRVRTCTLAPAGLSVAERWLSERKNLWERRLDRLNAFLELQDQEAPEDLPTPQKDKNKP